MKVPFVDLKAQYNSIKKKIDEAIADVIENTNFIGGDRVTEFEKQFADFIGIGNCIGCANGTDSMEMILEAMGVGEGDEVIVPANSWISTAEVVNNVGAEPVFVDVLENESTIDPELIERAITKKTKAIIPVHLYGFPARMESILQIAKTHQLKVIEDCAQAHGATMDGKSIGTFGDAASFSFYPGKNLGAYGDAGGVVTNDDELAQQVRMIGNHGQLVKHDHRIVGRNSRMDTLQAAILKVKLPYLKNWVEERNRVAKTYSGLLKSSLGLPHISSTNKHAFHLYVIRTKNRRVLQDKLRNEGIGSSIHYPTPLPLVAAYSYKDHSVDDFPIAVLLSREILSLPIFPEMTQAQIEKVVKVVNEVG
ncbi:MAG: DegT/DnrJ/EryC1/StrS family aminotransferase [Cyclobacteriaceae bacterium]